ncbi:MAG: hypothetical protein ACTHU0_32900 [Kofleriaceae bacterium]
MQWLGLLRSLPVALVVGCLGGAVLAMVSGFVHLFADAGSSARWAGFDAGAAIVEAGLIAFGLLELAHRLDGRARVAARIGAASLAVVAASVVAREVTVAMAAAGGMVPELGVWRLWIGALFALVLVMLITAAGAWRHAPLVAIAGIAAALRFGAPGAAATAVFAVAALALVARIARVHHAPPEDVYRFATGLRIAATSLHVQIAAALVVAAGVAGSWPSALDLYVLIGPAAFVATAMACACGLLIASQRPAAGVPSVSLCLGAGATLWWAGALVPPLAGRLAARLAEQPYRGLFPMAIRPWSMAGPVVFAVGTALVCLRMQSFARARGDQALGDASGFRSPLFVVLFAASFVLHRQELPIRSVETRFVVWLAGTVVGVCALVAAAGLWRKAAGAVGPRPGLPEARSLPT